MPKFISSFTSCALGALHRARRRPAGRAAVSGAAAERSCLRDRRAVADRPAMINPGKYAKLARATSCPKYGARYSPEAAQLLLEGDGATPCCMALLQFPSLDAVKQWYDSPENQAGRKCGSGVPIPAGGRSRACLRRQ